MMGNAGNYRIIVFDDHQEILEMLKNVFSLRGYEVLTYLNPSACPMFNHDMCLCPEGQTCADIILTDINMPHMKGIDFIERQRAKGCACKHVALMSGAFTSEDEKKARDLDLKFFKKPFAIDEVFRWLDIIEPQINPHRKLTEFKNLYN
jgi:DNA-binding response OmpR family regulator